MTEQKQVISEGDKQTEVGIIPVDWAVCRLSEITTRITDGTHDTPRPVKDGVPFLTAIHVKENSIDFNGCYFLPEIIHKEIYRRCNPEYGDVLMVNIGSGTATTAVVNVNYEFSLKNVALIKPNKTLVDGFFVNYFLGFNKERILESISTGGAQPFLSLSQISNLQISVPTKQEQTAIAHALSDVDALISELEKLIAKKQAIKTATMQQLLTGKTRLPEFALREDGTLKGYKQSELGEIPEDWDCCSLGEAVEFLDGLRKPVKSGDRAKISGIYPYYGASGIVDYVNDYLFDDDLILLGEDGENILSRSLPLAFQVSGKIWVNNHAHVLKPRDNFDIVYLTEFLESLDYSLLNSGTAQPKLNKQSCTNIKVLKPSKHA